MRDGRADGAVRQAQATLAPQSRVLRPGIGVRDEASARSSAAPILACRIAILA